MSRLPLLPLRNHCDACRRFRDYIDQPDFKVAEREDREGIAKDILETDLLRRQAKIQSMEEGHTTPPQTRGKPPNVPRRDVHDLCTDISNMKTSVQAYTGDYTL